MSCCHGISPRSTSLPSLCHFEFWAVLNSFSFPSNDVASFPFPVRIHVDLQLGFFPLKCDVISKRSLNLFEQFNSNNNITITPIITLATEQQVHKQQGCCSLQLHLEVPSYCRLSFQSSMRLRTCWKRPTRRPTGESAPL